MATFSAPSAPFAALAKQVDAALGADRCHGTDSKGGFYASTTALWHARAAGWYTDAKAYWDAPENCDTTVDGMLGGFANVSDADVLESAAFLTAAAAAAGGAPHGRLLAADCGGGIGRVAKHLLLPRYDSVEIVEQSGRLLAAAPAYVGEAARLRCTCLGMQDWSPAAASYDLIWIQWVVGHLNDLDLVAFLHRCRAALRPGGLVCIKDNAYANFDDAADTSAFCVDMDDSSVTRTNRHLLAVLTAAGMEVVLDGPQVDWSKEMYPVHMWALR